MKIDNLLPGQAQDIVGGNGDPHCWPDPDAPDPGFPYNLPGWPGGRG